MEDAGVDNVARIGQRGADELFHHAAAPRADLRHVLQDYRAGAEEERQQNGIDGGPEPRIIDTALCAAMAERLAWRTRNQPRKALAKGLVPPSLVRDVGDQAVGPPLLEVERVASLGICVQINCHARVDAHGDASGSKASNACTHIQHGLSL